MAAAGDTFILTRETRETPHLWILLCGPAGPAGAFLAAHLASWKPGRDRTCILQAGEHPFVQHETYVVYNDTRRITGARLQELIATRQAFAREPVSPELLRRLVAGLLSSPYTPYAMKELARDPFGMA
ncbi:MAG: hypothetical protein LC667_17225 [Thioalkalivibrio sp.]|nr:hypothetical protein [Thioalkalivibrio sp.]